MGFLKQPKRSGTTKYKSVLQEKRTAEEFEGRTTPMSGAGNIKGDVTTEEFLIECKTTSKTQFPVKLAVLEKLTKEAMNARKIPLMQVDLDDESKGLNRSWVLIPKDEFLELVERAKNGNQ